MVQESRVTIWDYQFTSSIATIILIDPSHFLTLLEKYVIIALLPLRLTRFCSLLPDAWRMTQTKPIGLIFSLISFLFTLNTNNQGWHGSSFFVPSYDGRHNNLRQLGAKSLRLAAQSWRNKRWEKRNDA